MGNFCGTSSQQPPPPSPPPPVAASPAADSNNAATHSTPNFSPNPNYAAADNSKEQKACFGAGCYWGTEKYFRYDFKKHYTSGKVVRGQVGFMGPKDAPKDPSYEDVCTGRTGHVEVYDLDYTGGLPAFEDLCKFFFQMHDPTTLNRQGNDAGTQYSSVIYCYSQEQFDLALKVKSETQSLLDAGLIDKYSENKVSTDVRMKTIFYEARPDHQDYLSKNPRGYCNHRIRFKPWPVMASSSSSSSSDQA